MRKQEVYFCIFQNILLIGKAIITISHDMEFVAENFDPCDSNNTQKILLQMMTEGKFSINQDILKDAKSKTSLFPHKLLRR